MWTYLFSDVDKYGYPLDDFARAGRDYARNLCILTVIFVAVVSVYTILFLVHC